MPKTFIGNTSSSTTTITIPTHVAGDMIIIVAYRNNTTPATVPAGWTTITSTGSTNQSVILGWQIAAAPGTASGTWTNASRLQAFVWRGPTGIGSSPAVNSATSGTTITYPAITLDFTDGTSALALFGGTRAINSTIDTAPSADFTSRGVFLDSVLEIVGHDSNAGVTSFSALAQSIGGTSATWTAVTVELEGGGDGGTITGTASGTHTITGQAVGDVDVSASASGAHTITGASAGSVPIVASAAGSLTISGSATATTASVITASASGTHTITGTAAGSLPIAATGAGSLTITGAASGAIRVSASTAGSLTITGTATGAVSVTRTASAAGTLDITGAATGTVADTVFRQLRLRPDGRIEAYIP